jgi:hypothetical protein
MQELLMALGESDCEALGDGWLAQPFNAVSSLAFSVVGVIVFVWAFRAEGRERRFRTVLGSLLVATGLGSFLFHGPQPATSQFAHDVTFLSVMATLGIGNLGGTLGWPERWTWIGVGGATSVAAAILVVSPGATNALFVISLGVIAASEVAIHRTGGGSGPWYAATLVLAVLALGLFITGRTDGWLCEPGSQFQLHGAWHVAIAAAIGTYAAATAPARLRGDTA